MLGASVRGVRVGLGAVAQLVERLNGIQEVRGSNPLSSIGRRGRSSVVEHLLPKQRVVSSNLIARLFGQSHIAERGVAQSG